VVATSASVRPRLAFFLGCGGIFRRYAAGGGRTRCGGENLK
jgi:hypothetical protein